MQRAPVLIVLGVAILVAAMPQWGEAKSPPEAIAGGDLPHPVTLPFADRAALWDATPAPELVAPPTMASGPAYAVTSWYWSKVLQGVIDPRAMVEAAALYEPASGVVRVQAGAERYWLRLDDTRRRILDRYIRFTKAGLLPEEPTLLQMLAATARDERVTVRIDRFVFEGASARHATADLPAALVASLWQAAPSAEVSTAPHSFRVQETDFDLVFGLPEGRTVSLRFEGWRGLLLDNAEQSAGIGMLTAMRLPDEVVQPLRQTAAALGGTSVAAPSAFQPDDGGRPWQPAAMAATLAALLLLIIIARVRRALRGAGRSA